MLTDFKVRKQKQNRGVLSVPREHSGEKGCLLSKYTELTININTLAIQKQDHVSAPWNPSRCVVACLLFSIQTHVIHLVCKLFWLTCGSAGKESACNVGHLSLIPELGRSLGEGKGCLL